MQVITEIIDVLLDQGLLSQEQLDNFRRSGFYPNDDDDYEPTAAPFSLEDGDEDDAGWLELQDLIELRFARSLHAKRAVRNYAWTRRGRRLTSAGHHRRKAA